MLNSKTLSADTWLERLESSNYTYLLLFALSMGETLILPIPIEAILIPWMLRKPEKRWVIAAVALAGNITAASLGYWLGALAMDQWGDSLIQLFGGAEVYDSFATELKENGFMSVLAVGITPTPLQIAMLAAGATGFSFVLFLLAVALSRSVRYFGLALLVQVAGDAAMKLWRRYSRQLGAVLLVLAGVWVWFTFFR
ncbi:YqaA family protein [Rheinheimera aquimaris]|jgi:membrane protein YqaA with SNARE-associated domain|nr:VTT domain-containing protein [Rheinheimera aquimaris]HBN88178.1 alkaline phosphatase [Rheinheimera sp.]